jgi:hypothetical protein
MEGRRKKEGLSSERRETRGRGGNNGRFEEGKGR